MSDNAHPAGLMQITLNLTNWVDALLLKTTDYSDFSEGWRAYYKRQRGQQFINKKTISIRNTMSDDAHPAGLMQITLNLTNWVDALLLKTTDYSDFSEGWRAYY